MPRELRVRLLGTPKRTGHRQFEAYSFVLTPKRLLKQQEIIREDPTKFPLFGKGFSHRCVPCSVDLLLRYQVGMALAKMKSGRSWRIKMKRLTASLLCLLVLSITAIPAGAQTRRRVADRAEYRQRYEQSRRYDQYVNDDSDDPYPYRRNRSVWDSHRDKITTAGGAVGGALIGGLIGGKKGALIGAIAGGGSAALYTYKIRDN